MKDKISNTDLLLIRHCKKNNTSIDILRKIVAKGYALPYSYVTKEDVARCLTRIVIDYDLIRQWEEFLLVDINPKKWWTKEEKPYIDNLLEQLISKISCTEVKVFPRYPNSAWFRNKYPKDETLD